MKGKVENGTVSSKCHTTAGRSLCSTVKTLPVVDRTVIPAELHGLVQFTERRSLVSVRVPPRSNCSVPGLFPGGKAAVAWRLPPTST